MSQEYTMRKRRASSTNGVGENWTDTYQTIKLDRYLTPYKRKDAQTPIGTGKCAPHYSSLGDASKTTVGYHLTPAGMTIIRKK